MRVERLLANLGYGKRRECATLIKRGAVTNAETGAKFKARAGALPRCAPAAGPRPLCLKRVRAPYRSQRL